MPYCLTRVVFFLFLCCYLIFNGCSDFYYDREYVHESAAKEVVQDRKPVQTGPLLFPETFVDIGEENGNISYTFLFKNNGNELVDNFQLSASCGCTTVKLEPETVAPNKEGKIVLFIDQSASGQGDHLYSVQVDFKVDNKPFQVVLYLQSHNKSEILFNPKDIYIETYSDGVVTRYIKLINFRRKNFSVQNIVTASSWITCQQVPETSTDNTEIGVTLFEVNVDMSKIPDGNQESVIALLTNDEEFSQFTLPVTIKKLPQIHGIPDKIRLTKLQEDSLYVGKTTIRHCEGKPMAITDIELTPQSHLKKYTIEHDEQKNSYLINVFIDAKDILTSPNMQLTFKIINPCQRNYSIPLICP
ncbi:MAG: DUF1573 domain-containing protein [Planctomycetaceae bacterium]|jgi:hypothetical protein|nr:DUF1573 domain-containing protein [Planctomycetaceae bacterium]